MKVILFNAPPRAGKDTAADLLTKYLNGFDGVNAFRYSFARPLKEATHALYGIDAPWDAFEFTKDMPQEKFFGLSPREAYIKVSEEMVKPVLGAEHWGNVFLSQVKKYGGFKGESVVVVSDCGFITEVLQIKKEIQAHNMFLVYMEREGTSFKNDSRSYVKDPSIPSYYLDNNGDLAELASNMEYFGQIILGQLGIKHD